MPEPFLAALTLAAIALVAIYRGHNARPSDERTALPCWYDEAMLRDVAAQNGVDRKPVEIETRSGHGAGVRLPAAFGKTEGGTRTLHKLYDDPGELIARLVEGLNENGRLNRDADQLDARDLTPRPLSAALAAGEARTEELFAEWLREHYPNGLEGVDRNELARRLATIDGEVPEWEVRAGLLAAHRDLAGAESSIQLLEGRWEVEGEEGDLLLERADVRIADRSGGEPRSHPLPAGLAIQVRLDGELTHHGRGAMLGVTQPIQVCVLGTVRQHEASTGRLEIAPIAVFQRG